METLEDHLGRLTEFLNSWGVPEWKDILIGENLSVEPYIKQAVSRSELHCQEDFSDRFDEIIKAGHSWVNLSGLGILENTLIVALEKPNSGTGNPFTSVNYSGPMNCVKENNYNLDKFIELTN